MATRHRHAGWIESAKKACATAIVRWAGVPYGSGDGFAYNKDGAPLNCAGVSVSTSTALQLATVWACVSLLSDTISTLPIGVFERTDAGRKPAVNHPLYGMVRRQPNTKMTMSSLLGATVASMLFTGNGYWERIVSGGQTVGLKLLVPDRLSKVTGYDGKVRWLYTDPGETKQREIPVAVLVKIPGFSLDGETGLSAIAYGCRMFGNAISADAAAASTFEKGLLPTTVFTYPETLKESQRDDARAALVALSGAVNAGKPVILEGGTKAEALGINPADAQLLESRGFSTEEICRWFRVPPFMVGHNEKSTSWGTGIEQQMIGFLQFSLRPWLRRIEEAFSMHCLRPEERDRYYVEFAIEGLLRADSAARATFYSTALQNGWLTRNEVRRLENLPAVDGGDVVTVQSNLVPLDQLGQAPADAAARSTLLAWLGIKENEHAAA